MKQSASVEADDGGDLTFVEVAADGVADGLFEFRDGFGFGEDGGGQGGRASTTAHLQQGEKDVSVTITEPGSYTLAQLYKAADIVALVKVIAADDESYLRPVYKSKVIAGFRRRTDALFRAIHSQQARRGVFRVPQKRETTACSKQWVSGGIRHSSLCC